MVLHDEERLNDLPLDVCVVIEHAVLVLIVSAGIEDRFRTQETLTSFHIVSCHQFTLTS